MDYHFIIRLLMMENCIHWKALVMKTNTKMNSISQRRRYNLVAIAALGPEAGR